jgi:hypothetical protein
MQRSERKGLFLALIPLMWAHTTFGASKPLDNVKDAGGSTFVDGSLIVTDGVQTYKYFETVGVSTPSTPATSHSRLWLNATDKRLCSVFDDGSTACLGSSSGGTITGVTAGNGLSGGGTTGTVSLSVNFSSVTAMGSVFNGASQLVALNGSSQLPAVSGVNLTLLNASNIGSGTLTDGRLSSNVALLASTQSFTGANAYASTSTFNGNVVVSSGLLMGTSAGTSGQVLTSGGVGTVPTWTTSTVSTAPPSSLATSYTPTFSAGWGTPSNIAISYMQIGKAVHVWGSFTVGTVAASSGTIGLPAGLPVSTARYTANKTWLGHSVSFTSATSVVYTAGLAGFLYYDGSSTTCVFGDQVSGGAFITRNISAFFSSSTNVSIDLWYVTP